MALPDFNAAQAATIERNDIVVQVARMLDPGAFTQWYRSSDGVEAPIQPDVRKRYAQAAAISLAASVLKFAATFKQDVLQNLLANSEAADWELLGIPVNETPAMRQIIDAKHGLAGKP